MPLQNTVYETKNCIRWPDIILFSETTIPITQVSSLTEIQIILGSYRLIKHKHLQILCKKSNRLVYPSWLMDRLEYNQPAHRLFEFCPVPARLAEFKSMYLIMKYLFFFFFFYKWSHNLCSPLHKGLRELGWRRNPALIFSANGCAVGNARKLTTQGRICFYA